MSRVSILALSLFVAACSKKSSPAPAEAPPSSADAAPAAVAPDASTTSAQVPAGPWNVILISIDSLRADMPWAGYERPIAPRLTALHAKSTAYTRAYSTSSFTSKSVPGMLTGRYPSELTRTGSFFTVYPQKKEFFCPGLAEQDIPCVGAHAHMYFAKGNSGFEHGFREWKIVPGITFDYQTDPYVTSDKLTPLAIETLNGVSAGTPDKPFFAWFHYMDPHDEYKGHTESPHFGKRPRDLYDEEIFFTDLWVGKLLDHIEAQPWAARTVIAVTADHGEAFGEHGITRHAHEVWEMLVHVPLFFYVPGQKARTIDVPRSAVDLVPTFLELLGAKPMEGIAGKSMLSELRAGEAEARDVIVDLPEDDYNERRRALIHEKWKLIAFGDDVRFALFDLEADPKEENDLFWKQRELGEEMRQRYKRIGKGIKDIPPKDGIPGKRDR